MDRLIAREHSLSRLLMTYIVTGAVFMLLPGTFLGVWSLIKISSHEAAESISPAWIQAHGHAQLFGWVGIFILAIGFYSIPQTTKTEAVCYLASVGVLGTLDHWRDHALVLGHRAGAPSIRSPPGRAIPPTLAKAMFGRDA